MPDPIEPGPRRRRPRRPGRRVDRSRRHEDSQRDLLLHPLVLPSAVVVAAYDGLLGLDLVTGRSDAAPPIVGVLLLALALLVLAATVAAAAATATRPADGHVPAAARWRLLGSAWPLVLIGAAAVTGLLALAGVRL